MNKQSDPPKLRSDIEFRALVEKMRHAQMRYYKERTEGSIKRELLIDAKKLEAEVDLELAKKYQLELFA